MEEMLIRFMENMSDRVTGPMKFRLLLQPLMATIFAIQGGLADAKAGKAPYFWGLITDPAHRSEMVQDGWKSVGKVFVLAMILDVVYQLIALRFVYPGEAIVTAFVLAIVPYLLLRGFVTRIARPWYLEAEQGRGQEVVSSVTDKHADVDGSAVRRFVNTLAAA